VFSKLVVPVLASLRSRFVTNKAHARRDRRPSSRRHTDCSIALCPSDKLFAGILQQIKDKQAEKDVAKLAQLRTKREKRLLENRTKSVA
jgi:hypothetical protein